MPWLTRGLREGIVTTGYPRRTDGYHREFRSSVNVRTSTPTLTQIIASVEICPTKAISSHQDQLVLDSSKCILCGRCVDLLPGIFAFDADFAVSNHYEGLESGVETIASDAIITATRGELFRRVRALHRSIFIRHVDAGSDGADEWEVAALANPVYDVQRLGISFTTSPKHADILLVTGLGSSGMIQPILDTFLQMPEPKIVVLAGVDALSGGLVGPSYASRGGLLGTLPVDVVIPGSPPSPFALLHGILLATGLIATREELRR